MFTRDAVRDRRVREAVADRSAAVNVLVAEDDADLRELLCRMLARGGHGAAHASNGREALKRFHERRFDVVITDMLMPEMDGIELIRALRVVRPGLPIIAISGVDEWAEYLRIAIQLGARAALRKPIAAPQLLAAISEVMTPLPDPVCAGG